MVRTKRSIPKGWRAADSRPYGVPPGLGPYGMVRLVPSSVTGFARATFPVGEGFLRRGTKPSPGRGWQGEALTGVGRYEPGPGAAPSSGPEGAYRSSGVTVAVRLFPLIRHGLCPCHLPRGGRRPPAGDKTLSWERVARRSRDGCGAVRTRTRYRHSSGPGGCTVHPGLLWPSGCIPSSVTGFARATFPVGEGFLRRGTKPSPGRGWLGGARDGCGAA